MTGSFSRGSPPHQSDSYTTSAHAGKTETMHVLDRDRRCGEYGVSFSKVAKRKNGVWIRVM